ncbi:molybdenum cofactor sulfurase [Chelatococcus sambhunathii]|uniref:Molybdenum cofactor sulfurase n=1 Tax=Chelatococcus sambhunathii TaxID=363953 RepID=A0ABU1DIM7_9HYPH|nr:molybdenum cofactor sulfurase [Chelatococcus sambhunathii]MDR4307957.1 molybdenum cofactor sulfurase [Chelatococcus sambhunathii]
MTRELIDQIVIHPGRRLTAKLVATLKTTEPDSFETTVVDQLDLTFEGLAGDRHAGFTRPAGGREPWYPGGVEIKSGRQLSIVSAEELWEIGYALGLPPIEAGWMGANLVIEGAPRLSFLSRGTRIFMPSGASVVVENQNAPCRHTGRAIATRTGRPGDELSFPRISRRLRGLVASVERPGAAVAGSDVTLQLPEQWIY